MASSSKSSSLLLEQNVLPRRPIALLRVQYDYEYDYKTRQVSVRSGELLHLLQKTNEHWWKVVRPPVATNKPFFVPAQYVTEVGDQQQQEEDEDNQNSIPHHHHQHHHWSQPPSTTKKENGDKNKSPLAKFHSLSISSPSSSSRNGSFTKDTGGGVESSSSSKSKTKESSSSSFFSFSSKSGSSSGSKGNKITRNDGSRASHREKNSTKQGSFKISPSTSSSSSAAAGGKLKNWSASLEELSKQIVFPGLASESVADLTFVTRGDYHQQERGHQQQRRNERREDVDKEEENGAEEGEGGSRRRRWRMAGENDADKSSLPSPHVLQQGSSSFNQEQDEVQMSSFHCDNNRNQNQIIHSNSDSFNKCLTFRNPTFHKNSSSMGSVDSTKSTSEEKLETTTTEGRNSSNSSSRNISGSPIQSPGSLSFLVRGGSNKEAKSYVNNMESDECAISLRTKSVSGTIPPKEPRLPTTPPISSPVRKLADDWAEYYSPDSKRYFYYNSKTQIKSWKPPRNSSSSSSSNKRKSDEHLHTGSSLSDGSANASSLEKSLENIPDLVGSPNLSFETELSAATSTTTATADKASTSHSSNSDFLPSSSNTTFQLLDDENCGKDEEGNNNRQKSRSSESIISLKDEYNTDEAELDDAVVGGIQNNNNSSNNNNNGHCSDVAAAAATSVEQDIPIPQGWSRKWDDPSQQFCYVNQKTGARWFTSTDEKTRVYYYEENSSNSSWRLPDDSDATIESQIQSSTTSNTKEGNVSVSSESASLQEKSLDSSSLKPFGVKKRHSAGEVVDRNLKTKSLLISTHDLRKHEFDKSGSLPRFARTIWANGKLDVVREGIIARSKITENGKKLRKSWGTVYAVLTDTHLSLFKDEKSYLAPIPKTEVEIELTGATVEWTEEKSSRKNVFQLTQSDLQILFQVEAKNIAVEWFEAIKHVSELMDDSTIQSLDSPLNSPMRLRSAEGNLLDLPPVGEGKISSRLNRNKSTKLRITPVDDKEKIKIKDHLRKFFSRRPPRESLVKKGIYKDESVFGCSLEKLCSYEKGDVPRFVQECIVAIESKTENLKTDGLYRASGNLSQVQKIRLQVDQNNLVCLIQEEDVHVLAGCLKLFFRELKDPLISSELFEKALQACHAPTRKEKLNLLREVVNSLLAKPNRCTLQELLRHLLNVAAYSEFNRMQIPNLAIVFGPTLIHALDSANMATDLMQQNLVIECLMLEYENIFQ